MPWPLRGATCGWRRKVFHCLQLTQIFRNSRSLFTICLRIPSLMPLEMRKVQARSGCSPRRPGRQWLKTRIQPCDAIVVALYTDGRGSRDYSGTDGSQWLRRTVDQRANLMPGNSHPPRTRDLSSYPPAPLEMCPVPPSCF